MEFSNTIFILGFLPVIFLIYFLVPSTHKNKVLFFSNLVLYAWVEPILVFLLLFLMTIDFVSGIYINKLKSVPLKRSIIFWSTIVLNVLTLIIFKYYLIDFSKISNTFTKTLIPFGFSIYIFQGLSYVIDLYLQKVRVQKNFINFGVYMAFFPQLVCGPILRYSDMRIELENREESQNKIFTGYGIFIKGLAKKIFFADTFFSFWSSIKNLNSSYTSILSSWLGIICFMLAVYFYLSAYSDMSRGIGKIFGFELPINFNYPYLSKSIAEFSRRFNISLTNWYKTYIFTPLGTNFNNKIVASLRLILIWFFIGLWYGNSINYIIWGLLLGLLILCENLFLSKLLIKLPKAIQRIYTLILLLLSFVIFAFSSLTDAFNFYSNMFTGNFIDKSLIAFNYLKQILPILIIGCICCSNLGSNLMKKVEDNNPNVIKWVRISFDLILTIICFVYIIAQNFSQYNSLPFFNLI